MAHSGFVVVIMMNKAIKRIEKSKTTNISLYFYIHFVEILVPMANRNIISVSL